ncbi:hypothetical protein ARMSODRAFT_983834 [Armillaria solidipes]|uniref:Uncharacterized protein n=1 Tax=Armillaria solidipes TaxID=1076256 RepID=A0A2H3AHH8_9AGAR|nr:hypothetical protein ARMSODRAFT_983834 [Armillaria solidipes]
MDNTVNSVAGEAKQEKPGVGQSLSKTLKTENFIHETACGGYLGSAPIQICGHSDLDDSVLSLVWSNRRLFIRRVFRRLLKHGTSPDTSCIPMAYTFGFSLTTVGITEICASPWASKQISPTFPASIRTVLEQTGLLPPRNRRKGSGFCFSGIPLFVEKPDLISYFAGERLPYAMSAVIVEWLLTAVSPNALLKEGTWIPNVNGKGAYFGLVFSEFISSGWRCARSETIKNPRGPPRKQDHFDQNNLNVGIVGGFTILPGLSSKRLKRHQDPGCHQGVVIALRHYLEAPPYIR